jgi:hypothetical protein
MLCNINLVIVEVHNSIKLSYLECCGDQSKSHSAMFSRTAECALPYPASQGSSSHYWGKLFLGFDQHKQRRHAEKGGGKRTTASSRKTKR